MKEDSLMTAERVESPRRRFLRDAATAAAATCLSPALLLGCGGTGGEGARAAADALEEALEMMGGLAPLTNHGPMAAEALVALGRAESVVPWAEAYRRRFTAAYPPAVEAVTRANWREALGDGRRVADWAEFFRRELKEAAWPDVLERWTALLAPGLAAAAAHGVIRTGHAARSLSVRETELRRRELAEGLAYWAAYYQPLPEASKTDGATKTNAAAGRLTLAEAVARIPLLPEEKRRRGSIMAGLSSLEGFPPFAVVADLVEVEKAADAGRFLSELTETFATVYVKHVVPANYIALVHAVTAASALRSLLPYLSPETTGRTLRYGWQTAAAIHSVYAGKPRPQALADNPAGRDQLVERAVATRDEHAIKFTEACLREYALNPSPAYLLAARDAVTRPAFG